MSPPELLAAAMRTDPTRPLITSYLESTGERTELSVATVTNWVAKLGNAMVDEWDLGPGDTVSLQLPAHWVGAVVALAVWSVGGEVADGDQPATAAVRRGNTSALTDRELVVALEPMGMDLSRLVAGWPDALLSSAPPGGAEIAAACSRLELPPGARLLSTLPLGRVVNVGLSVVAPLAVGGSTVLVDAVEPLQSQRLSQIAAVEQVSHSLGVDLPGVTTVATPRRSQ